MQNEEEIVACRLCLISCECNNEDVDAGTIEALRSLGLELDLNITGKPVICRICSVRLQKCFDFKTACLYTENCVNSFKGIESNAKLDLREIYLRKKENENVTSSKRHTVCRLCMEVAESGYYISLNNEADDVVLAKTVLGKCFSEIDLDTTENPIICTTCNESLRGYFSFIKDCLDMADRVKKCCKIEGGSNNLQVDTDRDIAKNWNESELYDETKVKLEYLVQNKSQELHIKNEVNDSGGGILSSLLQCPTTNISYCRNSYVDMNVVEKCQQYEENGASELKFKNSIKKENEFNVKHEEIDIKAGEDDTTRYQDIVLAPEDASANITYQCDICTFRTRCYSSLNQHMLMHRDAPEVTVYSCRICAFKSEHRDSLKQHIMLIHNVGSEVTTYSCEKCTFKSKHKASLKRHMLIHEDASEAMIYSCGICAFTSKHKPSLKRHMLVHKDGSEVTMYSCGICVYKTKYKDHLKKHMFVHKDGGVVMMSCRTCGYKAKCIDRLKRHMLIHEDASEVTTYSCGIYAPEAKDTDDLKKDMFVHESPAENAAHPCEEPVLYVPPIVVYMN